MLFTVFGKTETYKTKKNMENITTTERSTFLSVLCVLTFIGSGISLISGIYNYAMAPMAAEITEQVLSQVEQEIAYQDIDESTGNMLESVFLSSMQLVENASTLAIFNILAALLSLTGAYMMFKLQRKGFYMYAGGQLFLTIAPVALVGFNFVTGAALMVSGVFALIFIGMYGVNLKHMN
jgi:hypothetical protein